MKKLITYIEENLKRERLESASTEVINAYRKGDGFTLRTYAEALGFPADLTGKRLFYSLIRQLHPDRFSAIRRDFKKAVENGDRQKLAGIRGLLEVRTKAEGRRAERFEYEHAETWEVQPDSAFSKEHDADAGVFEFAGENTGFLEAVKDLIFGNHDFQLEPADLAQIDGGLDIAFCGLDDIDGIEYCRNVRVLNITGNSIGNIYDLQELAQLEEFYAADNAIRDIEPLSELEHLEIVDLSGNDIEDIEPLLRMSRLKFADIRKNPVQNRQAIEMLEENGVIVLY